MASGYDGHINKRQRTDDMRSDREDRLKPDPSAVVHVRNVPDGANESDMMHSLQQFGSIVYVLMMPARRQALVEFQDLESAKTCVSYAQHNPIYVRGQVSLFNYSTSQRIQRSQGDHVSNLPPNHILLFTVMKPDYPITCEVMHAICSPYGEIQRMVIFKKHGVQAMVEFDNVHSAKRAKEKLHGCDIYSGCCTLKVDFAKPTKLNVVRNDPEHSWDYTNPNLGDGKLALLGQGKDMSAPPRSAPLLQAPAGYGPRPTPYSGAPQDPGMGASPANSGGYGMYEQEGYGGYGSPPQRSPYDSPDRYGAQKPVPGMDRGPYGRGPSYEGQHGGPLVHNAPAPGPSSGAMIQGAVLMVYGLNMQKMNADRVFNLFCLYGNVVRVKFLKSKEGSAMVQMGDSLAVERCMQLLNGVIFFKQKMQLGVSKQAFLQDVNNPHDLPDGSQSFKDFMGNRNNRFANPEAASKNRIQPPTKVLHYFNAPPSLTEDEIMAMLESLDAPKPVKIKLFPSKTERSSSGLMEFSTKADSIEALILANHHSLENPSGKAPYVFKLCFSGTPIMYQ